MRWGWIYGGNEGGYSAYVFLLWPRCPASSLAIFLYLLCDVSVVCAAATVFCVRCDCSFYGVLFFLLLFFSHLCDVSVIFAAATVFGSLYCCVSLLSDVSVISAASLQCSV